MAISPARKKTLWIIGGSLLALIAIYLIFFGVPGRGRTRQKRCKSDGGGCYIEIGSQKEYVDCGACPGITA